MWSPMKSKAELGEGNLQYLKGHGFDTYLYKCLYNFSFFPQSPSLMMGLLWMSLLDSKDHVTHQRLKLLTSLLHVIVETLKTS